jgi:hypothetical protein
MDFEKAGRCLPRTMTLKPFFMLTSEYENFMSAHDVAKKMRLSCMKGQNTDRAVDTSVLPSRQYFVGPMLKPLAPIGTAMQPASTESHVMEKKVMTYLLFS